MVYRVIVMRYVVVRSGSAAALDYNAPPFRGSFTEAKRYLLYPRSEGVSVSPLRASANAATNYAC